jgi:hypothetical protein
MPFGGAAPEADTALSVRGVPIAFGDPCWAVYVAPPGCVTYAFQPVAPGAVGGESIVIVEVVPVVVIACAELGNDSPLAVTYVISTR